MLYHVCMYIQHVYTIYIYMYRVILNKNIILIKSNAANINLTKVESYHTEIMNKHNTCEMVNQTKKNSNQVIQVVTKIHPRIVGGHDFNPLKGSLFHHPKKVTLNHLEHVPPKNPCSPKIPIICS